MSTAPGRPVRCPECGHALNAGGEQRAGLLASIIVSWAWIVLVIVLSLTAGQGLRMLILMLLELRPGAGGLAGMLRLSSWWAIILSVHLLLAPVFLVAAIWGRRGFQAFPARWQLGLLGAATSLMAADFLALLLLNW